MAIVQISKIQQRSGNIVDLPQLDEAEFGFASDAKRLFIGKVSPNENIEVLTSYSNISFSQIQGADGNLDISNVTVADGQVLTFDGTNWVNRGGAAGGLITLGNVANVRIDGGAIGYTLETDGTGNLSWTPKTTVLSLVQSVSNANPAVVTTVSDNFFTNQDAVTFTNLPGISGSVGNNLNGDTLYAKVLTSNTFSLYTDIGLTTTYNATADTAFPSTTATATSATNNRVTVTSSTPFTLNNPIRFKGTMFGILDANITYYVKSKPSSTTLTLSLTAGGTTLVLTTDSGSCTVYEEGGRVISSISGGAGTATAGGSNTAIQFNNNNVIDGDSDFTWNYATNLLTVNGNANVGNLNASTLVSASSFTSNIATGTAPLTVTSTTRVANLNVAYANVADFINTSLLTTGTYYPILANATSGNVADGANANLAFNVATGNLSTTILYANSTITALGNIAGANVDTAGNVTASRLISNVSTGTAPLTVTSTTRVANLNVAYANVADFVNVSDVTTGTYYPILANAATGNVSEGSNSALTFNAATGALNATLLGGTLTTGSQPNITGIGTLASLTVTGTVTLGDIATGGTAGDTLNITSANNSTLNGAGGSIDIKAGLGNGTGQGGNIFVTAGGGNTASNGSGGQIQITGGTGNGTGTGGQVGIYAGTTANAAGGLSANVIVTSGTTTGEGGNVSVSAGTAFGTDKVGGNVIISAGASTGSGAAARVVLRTSTPGSTGATTQVLADRVIIDDNDVNITMSTAATSTATGALVVAGGVGVAGNVYASFFYGAGNNLSNIQAANITGTVSNATHACTANTVINSTQSNITALGTLVQLNVDSGSLGTLSLPFNFEQTWNNSAVVFTGIKENITDTASDITSRLIDLQVGGTSRFYVVKNGNVVAANLNVSSSGTVTLGALTTGANTTVGNITGDWTLTAGSKLQSTYADLAEYYEADAIYEPGTVLEFGGNKEVTMAQDGTAKVAGVVSTNPAYAMNAKCPGIATAIALQGRVPVKVRGNVKKGDMMISGGNGFARPSTNPIIGSVIGKSLENFTGVEGIIEIAIGRL